MKQEEEPKLIFIVGLPRSGTTLTHQIISSHSKVYGAGELTILNDIFNKRIFESNFIKLFDQKIDDNSDLKELSDQILRQI